MISGAPVSLALRLAPSNHSPAASADLSDKSGRFRKRGQKRTLHPCHPNSLAAPLFPRLTAPAARMSLTSSICRGPGLALLPGHQRLALFGRLAASFNRVGPEKPHRCTGGMPETQYWRGVSVDFTHAGGRRGHCDRRVAARGQNHDLLARRSPDRPLCARQDERRIRLIGCYD